MSLKRTLIRAGTALAGAALALAMSAPVLPAAQAAGATVVVAPGGDTTGCGKYAGTSLTVYDEIATANTNIGTGTILVCPGTYANSPALTITGKITIKRADPTQTMPIIQPMAGSGFLFQASTAGSVSIDGLVIDSSGANASEPNYVAVWIINTTSSLTNLALIGPTAGGGVGIRIDNSGVSKPLTAKISSVYLAGFSDYGIRVLGATKASISGVTMDNTDNGRVGPLAGGAGIVFFGTALPTPTGSVSSSDIYGYDQGVQIWDASNVSISKTTFRSITSDDVIIYSDNDTLPANGTKILNCTFIDILNTGIDVLQPSGNPSAIKTIITGNRLIAHKYHPGIGLAINFDVVAPTPPTLTATITKTIFQGFDDSSSEIANSGGNAALKVSGSIELP